MAQIQSLLRWKLRTVLGPHFSHKALCIWYYYWKICFSCATSFFFFFERATQSLERLVKVPDPLPRKVHKYIILGSLETPGVHRIRMWNAALHCKLWNERMIFPRQLSSTALVNSEVWGFFHSGHRIPVDQGTPASRIQCLMIWGGADVLIMEIKCTINIMHFDHPETIPPCPHPRPWKNCIPECQKVGDHCCKWH